MKKYTPSLIAVAIIIVAVVGALAIQKKTTTTSSKNVASGSFVLSNGQSGSKADLAAALTRAKAKFYGAYWCTHCKNQKASFGSAAKDLPYIECSAPDGVSQMPECRTAKITSYPTWVFADSSQLSGQQSLATLAKKISFK